MMTAFVGNIDQSVSAGLAGSTETAPPATVGDWMVRPVQVVLALLLLPALLAVLLVTVLGLVAQTLVREVEVVGRWVASLSHSPARFTMFD